MPTDKVMDCALRLLALAALWLFCETLVLAAEEDKAHSAPAKESTTEQEPLKTSKTVHKITIGSRHFKYSAVAGEVLVEPEGDVAKGRIFYAAYELEGAKIPERPLTFAFNGGPGAASVWLHLGGLGPKRIVASEDGQGLSPPVRYKDNPYSWLIFTDLVFIDPIGTGFSRSEADDEKASQAFYGVQQDIKAIAEFIRLYLSKTGRWMSPKFLVGESYGTARAAGLAWRLHQRYGIDLNALVLISPVLDFQTILFHPSSDLPHVLFLPTYCATAWRHGLLSKRLQQKHLSELLDEVEAFCLNDYTVLLAKGDTLTQKEEARLLEQLHMYTSLPHGLIKEHHFRIDWMLFTKNLLKDKDLLIGRMNSAIAGLSPDPTDPRPRYDPSLNALYGPFSSAMNAYVREELEFQSELFYEFLSPDVSKKWDWSSGLTLDQGFVNFSQTLKELITIRKSMKVFVACGIYDLATPHFASTYTLQHMWLGDAASGIVVKDYNAGHMIYMNNDALISLFRDARDFYAETLKSSAN